MEEAEIKTAVNLKTECRQRFFLKSKRKVWEHFILFPKKQERSGKEYIFNHEFSYTHKCIQSISISQNVDRMTPGNVVTFNSDPQRRIDQQSGILREGEHVIVGFVTAKEQKVECIQLCTLEFRKADTNEPELTTRINVLDETIEKNRESLEKCNSDSGILGGHKNKRWESTLAFGNRCLNHTPSDLLFPTSQNNPWMPEHLATETSTILLLVKSRKQENKIKLREIIGDYQT